MSDNIKAGLITSLIWLALALLLYLILCNFEIFLHAMMALFIYAWIHLTYLFVLESIRGDKS